MADDLVVRCDLSDETPKHRQEESDPDIREDNEGGNDQEDDEAHFIDEDMREYAAGDLFTNF